jgi:CO/xanthine dehydrogenase Mo-binding subunit
MEDRVTTSPQKWMNHDGKARFRNDALSKVCGDKVFARDIRAKDMPGWPAQQGHACCSRPPRPTVSMQA